MDIGASVEPETTFQLQSAVEIKPSIVIDVVCLRMAGRCYRTSNRIYCQYIPRLSIGS